jgi:5-methylcytosine-specific restriction endonuclease McrA
MTTRGKANPRNANGHRRRRIRARVLAEEDICWICGQPVDKRLKTPHPGSPEVDEIIPVSLGGDPLDRKNCRLSHRLCNVRRGDGRRSKAAPNDGPIIPVRTSPTWSV